MNAKDVVEKLKEVLLGATEEVVETPAVEEQVELQEEVATDEVQEEVKEELAEDAVSEDAPVEAQYATKEELNQEIAQLRAMIDEIMSGMGAEASKDAPQELSADKVEQPQEEVELSADEVAEIKHNPEAMVENKELNLYAQSRKQSTFDKVLSKISNK